MTIAPERDGVSLAARARQALSGEAVRSALRFSAAILVADAACVGLVGDHATAIFGSFAVIAMLYFCDFDGSIAERSWAYTAVWAVSIVGIVAGTALASSTLASVIAATLVAAILAFLRVFRGLIARSSVAVQLPFLMCLLLPAQFSTLLDSLACWTIGCAVSLGASHLIFPRHRSGKVRGALSTWCASMATLTPLVVETSAARDAAVAHTISTSESSLIELLSEGSRWPGVLSRRLRALTEMALEALGVTLLVERIKTDDGEGAAHGRRLAGVTAEAFTHAALVVADAEPPGRVVDVGNVRQSDVDQVATWSLAGFASSVDQTLASLRRYHVVRVLSMASDEMQRLAMRSEGSDVVPPSVGLADLATPAQVVRSGLSGRSIWLRDALCAGLGLGASVFIAREIGIAHGFWVALAALSLLATASTPTQSSRAAWPAVGGAVVGMLLGVGLLVMNPSAGVLVVVLVGAAFVSRWRSFYGPFGAQASFSFLAIVTVSLMNWPPTIQNATVRFVDVAIGIAVALVATVLVFPRGPAKIVENARQAAMAAGDELLLAMRHFGADLTTERQERSALRAQAATSAFGYRDFALEVGDLVSPDSTFALTMMWLRGVITGSDALEQIADHLLEPAGQPSLLAHLAASPGATAASVSSAIRRSPPRTLDEVRVVVGSLWAAEWLDLLDTSRPA